MRVAPWGRRLRGQAKYLIDVIDSFCKMADGEQGRLERGGEGGAQPFVVSDIKRRDHILGSVVSPTNFAPAPVLKLSPDFKADSAYDALTPRKRFL